MSPTARELRFRQRRHEAVRQAASLAVVATVAFALFRWLHLGDEDVVLRAYAVGLGAIGLGLLVAIARWGTEDRTAQGRMLDELARPDDDAAGAVPAGLKQASSTVTLALRSAAGRDRWLRGEVRSIVEGRLAPASLETRRGAARAADARLVAQADRLAAPTWELIRPDRRPSDSREPGLSPAELASILDDLEHL